jgi:hypothetical protein
VQLVLVQLSFSRAVVWSSILVELVLVDLSVVELSVDELTDYQLLQVVVTVAANIRTPPRQARPLGKTSQETGNKQDGEETISAASADDFLQPLFFLSYGCQTQCLCLSLLSTCCFLIVYLVNFRLSSFLPHDRCVFGVFLQAYTTFDRKFDKCIFVLAAGQK